LAGFSPTSSVRGAALILVLAMLVLLLGLVLAFFSRAMASRQMADSGVGRTKAQILARGAVEQMIGDLRQEIAAGSLAPASTNSPVYFPKTPWSAVPFPTDPAHTDNVVKWSQAGKPFFDGSYQVAGESVFGRTGDFPPSQRASALTTTTPSSNGRVITLARWNKALLLSKNEPASSDTAPTTSFRAPDWVLVSKNGSNPTALGPGVVGRYAYVIYDAGSLLDANVAGYMSDDNGIPVDFAASQIGWKGGLPAADLTKIGMSGADTAALIAWRNPATSGPNYLSHVLGNTNGFLRVAAANGKTDRAFPSRRSLIDFVMHRFTGDTASKQNLLPYLGHFTRGINQLAFGADGPAIPGTPAPIPTETATGSYSLSGYTGNNDAAGAEEQINPRLLEVRATTEFTRFQPASTNPQQARAADPLVDQRFPLHRLAWLTHQGPIAPAGNLVNDAAIINPLLSAGLSEEFLRLGTEENILAAFGLRWSPDPAGSGRNLWVYDRSSSGRVILRLEDVAGLARSPNFLEILKASIHVGSLGKGAASGDTPGFWIHARNVRTDFHLLQIFANIVDQYDSDGYPTEIALPNPPFTDADLLGLFERKVVGVENLPYIYALRPGAVMVRNSVPAVPPGTVTANLTIDSTPVTNSGLGALFLHNWIWNPHDPTSSLGTSRPQQFRVVTYGGDPAHISYSMPATSLSTGQTPWPVGGNATNTLPTTTSNDPGSVGQLGVITAFDLNEQSTELLFDVPGAGYFSQPTALASPNVPANSNLRVGANHSLKKILPEGAGGSLRNLAPGGADYLGTMVATFPMRMSNTVGSTTYLLTACSANSRFGSSKAGQSTVGTSLLQYSDPNGNWVTYDVKSARFDWVDSRFEPMVAPGAPGQPTKMGRMAEWADPRTMRFGSPYGQRAVTDRAAVSTADASFQTIQPAGDPSNGDGKAYLVFGNPATGLSPANPTAIGWTNVTGKFFPQNLANNYQSALFSAYLDADGVQRGGMAAYAPAGTSTVGKPLATNNFPSRPIILNRPFKSVAELGYVFRDLPWKQLDFFTPESGDSALLDSFCLAEVTTPGALVAGRVNLNTRNARVLAALIAGGARKNDGTETLSAAEADSLAAQLIAWTSGTTANKGPLMSVGDMVGRYRNGSYSGYIPSNPTPFSGGASSENNVFQRFREAPVRALAEAGEVRVWNLMIDLVCQVGMPSPNPGAGDGFIVKGETRYWVHLALDRATAKVVALEMEKVVE